MPSGRVEVDLRRAYLQQLDTVLLAYIRRFMNLLEV